MSSSRWRRFAFFDRSSLILPDEVLSSLLPSPVSASSGTIPAPLPPLDKLYTSTELSEEIPDSPSTYFSITSTTASLTSYSSTTSSPIIQTTSTIETTESITTPRIFPPTAISVSALVSSCAVLPSNSSSTMEMSKSVPNKTVVPPSREPAVLIFVGSRNTNKVYCVDVSMRCNPDEQEAEEGKGGEGGQQEVMEEMDGYRGYIHPFLAEENRKKKEEEKIIREHMGQGESEEDKMGARGRILGLDSATTEDGNVHLGVITDDPDSAGVLVYINPHSTISDSKHAITYQPVSAFDFQYRGKPRCVSIYPGLVAVGTNAGLVVVYSYEYQLSTVRRKMSVLMEIPPPQGSDGSYMVSTVKLSIGKRRGEEIENRLYVGYKRKLNKQTKEERMRPMGVCCYDLGNVAGKRSASFSARFDLDGRDVESGGMCALDVGRGNLVVARSDGLYIYMAKHRAGVAPIDGDKIVMCCVPSSNREEEAEGDAIVISPDATTQMTSYALIASKDSKSSRDAVDIYDTNNKLVAFHVLLSPGHQALQATGVTTVPTWPLTNKTTHGRASAIILTSGGTILTLTEKTTSAKVSLLLQKNLFTAAITMSYSDPTYSRDQISHLYRKHAEFLYRKGEHAAAMDQYIHTIGMAVVEPSHVIYRYLDAPKIPLLVKYLEALRKKNFALDGHLNLLKACYYKLNDTEQAERVAEESDWRMGRSGVGSSALSVGSLATSQLSQEPMEALKTICSLEAGQAAEALVVHGSTLARALPRETAGIVISLCDGTYSPHNLAKAGTSYPDLTDKKKTLEKKCDKFSVSLFSTAFLENPKLLRLILAHCRKHKCVLSPGLRRTLLELTLEEWREARERGDLEVEKLRCTEALASLTDSHAREIGDYEALVIVQLAGFTEGEVLLYERLQMAPMLLERYAMDGGERARRQMLAMCRSDPELLADVLGYFVALAGESLAGEQEDEEENSEDSQNEAIFEDIQEALEMARAQGVLPPVRIIRILAGEGTAQFTSTDVKENGGASVPLSVALDYVGGILDDASKKITRMKNEVEEYNNSCNAMETEINALLMSSTESPKISEDSKHSLIPSIDIEEMYEKLRESLEDGADESSTLTDQEEFWREMGHSEDRFETITRFFGKGIIQ